MEFVVPVPVRATVALDALETAVKVALSAAAAVGENFSLSVQLPDTAKANGVAGHVVEYTAKSVLPLIDRLVIVTEAVELLVSVTVVSPLLVPCCSDPNATVVGEKDIAPVAIPVPVSVIDCGELTALSVKTSEAVRLPSAAGVKLTLTTQLPLGRTAPQLSVSLKSLALVPLIATDPMTRLALAGFVTVTSSGPAMDLRG